MIGGGRDGGSGGGRGGGRDGGHCDSSTDDRCVIVRDSSLFIRDRWW